MHKESSVKYFFILYGVVLLASKTYGQFQTFNPPKLEGETCGSLDGQDWSCRKESDCADLPSLAQKGWVITCSAQGTERVVCCPQPVKPQVVLSRTTPSISEQKCQEYQSVACSNKWGNSIRSMRQYPVQKLKNAFPGIVLDPAINETNRRAKRQSNDEAIGDEDIFDDHKENTTRRIFIRNGDEAGPAEFPHAALVGYTSKRSWLCGGTLISDRFVLSAAHCAYPANLGPAKWVRLGDLDYGTDTDTASPQDFFIVERFLHPDYNEELFYNDIALFRLDHPAVFNRFVAPACLHSLPSDVSGTVTASGWGRIGRQRGESSRLLKIDLNLVETDVCKNIVDNSKEVDKKSLPTGIDGKTMICAWEDDKDTCRGDSGGPLILTESPHCLGHQVGITSFGPGSCDKSRAPGVYTRVTAFLPWLESIVWPTPGVAVPLSSTDVGSS